MLVVLVITKTKIIDNKFKINRISARYDLYSVAYIDGLTVLN